MRIISSGGEGACLIWFGIDQYINVMSLSLVSSFYLFSFFFFLLQTASIHNSRVLFLSFFSCLLYCHSLKNFAVECSQSGDSYNYNTRPPLPSQRNLTPPPTLYPQQPVFTSENYSFPRISASSSSESIGAARTKRSDFSAWEELWIG